MSTRARTTFRLARAFGQSISQEQNSKPISNDMINQILRYPTKELAKIETGFLQTIPKKSPESIFDLNKSKLEDIYNYFLEVGNVGEVNKRFGTNIREFRYGLPLPNIDPEFKSIPMLKEELNPTPLSIVENLYNELALVGDSSWEEYENAIQNRYNFANLLGDTDENSPEAIELYELQKGLAIPKAKLENEKFMLQIRQTFSLNFNIPGSVELIDVNRFIEGLRPVDEFRHTPVIPISPIEMAKFEEKKRKRREEPFHVVYTKEKMFTLLMFMGTGVVIYLFFKFAMEMEETMFIDYRRTKLKRLEESAKNGNLRN